MLTYLEHLEELWGPFRLFGFITVRAMLAGFTALLMGWVIGPRLIRWLTRLKMRETGRNPSEIGRLADLHKSKSDIPTMGGLLIFLSVWIAVFLWARPNWYVFTAMVVYFGLTLIGFADDYLKVVRRNSRGLSGKWKLLGQAILTLVAVGLLMIDPVVAEKSRELWVPFYKHVLVERTPLLILIPFLFLILAGSSNAINLTDGIDGLAIGCTVTAALALGLMAYFAGNVIISDYLFISYVAGAGELSVVAAALLGASLAFLWYNAHPAEIFMGDTGSLALGGLIGMIAFLIHQPLTLILIGGIFVIEAGSVIVQVASFKSTRRRVFLMSPIHHHFQLKGWHENKVTIRFWILSLVFALIGLASLKLR